jgi:hypothetical protein
MRMRPLIAAFQALAWAAAFLLPTAAWANPDGCTATARIEPADARVQAAVAQARREHQLFGGQTVERDGGMFRLGYYEAESGRLPGISMAAWERVALYWQALSPQDPPSLVTQLGRVSRAEALAALGVEAAMSTARARIAIEEALMRAALVDTPWSAAFISYLVKEAGFGPGEFAFSDSHSDYVGAALATSAAEQIGQQSAHAWRACDLATTPPRPGDLICATRASTAGLARFETLAAAMAARRSAGQSFPMHCDLVVEADAGGDGGLALIGGNVAQSVTLTRMRLDGRGVLDAGYVSGAGNEAPCGTAPEECRGHLGRRPWVVLLQFRY